MNPATQAGMIDEPENASSIESMVTELAELFVSVTRNGTSEPGRPAVSDWW